jgi:ABC-type amino acid transport substrate-binding protein
MKKIHATISIFIFSVLFISDIRSEVKEIKIMYFNVPPLIIVDENTGKLSGSTYDLIENYISKELGVKFIWDKSATTIPRQISILENSSDYSSALLVYSEERAKKVAFTTTPYIISKSSIAVLKSNKINVVNTVEDILNLQIGYGQGVYKSAFMSDSRIKYDYVSDANFAEISLKKMISNRIDAAYSPNKLLLLYQIRKLHLEDKVKLIDLPDKQAAQFVVFSKNAGDIVKRYNQVASKIDLQNIYKKILSKYIDVSKL